MNNVKLVNVVLVVFGHEWLLTASYRAIWTKLQVELIDPASYDINLYDIQLLLLLFLIKKYMLWMILIT